MQHGRLTQPGLLFTSLILQRPASLTHSWLLTLSNSLEHTTRSFPSLLRLQLSEVVFASKSSYYILRFIETYPIHTRQFHSITRAVNYLRIPIDYRESSLRMYMHALSPSHTLIPLMCCWLLLNLIQPTHSLSLIHKSLNALLACKQTCLLLLEYYDRHPIHTLTPPRS